MVSTELRPNKPHTGPHKDDKRHEQEESAHGHLSSPDRKWSPGQLPHNSRMYVQSSRVFPRVGCSIQRVTRCRVIRGRVAKGQITVGG